MKTKLTAAQLTRSIEIYSDILAVDQNGLALDIDSLKIVNVLAGISQAFSLDLYEVIDSFEDTHFESVDVFIERLRELEFA